MANNSKQAVAFSTTSPGFIYSLLVGGLTIVALAGVNFSQAPAELAGEITSSISSGGYYSLIGILAASVIFPVWNAYKKGSLSFRGIFKNTLTWIALGNIVFAGVALTGLTFPDGTVESIVGAVAAKDWTSLVSILVTVVFTTVARFIKK